MANMRYVKENGNAEWGENEDSLQTEHEESLKQYSNYPVYSYAIMISGIPIRALQRNAKVYHAYPGCTPDWSMRIAVADKPIPHHLEQI